jgi:hypothetical protein
MVVVASVPTERSAGAGTVLLGPEGIDVTGEVAVLEVLPEGHVRVDILVSLADDSVKERDLYVLVPLNQPVEGEVGVGGMPVERFQQDFVDPLIALFYDVLGEQKRHEAAVARAAMGGGLAAGPLGALAMLHESRQGARRVRGYGRLGAMPEQGTRFRLVRVEPRRALRVEELVVMPGLEELAPASWAALEAYEGRPCLLVRARTKRNWRDLRGREALWSEGLWLGFTQEMAAGGDGALQLAYPLRTAGGDSTSLDVQAVFVTASEATPLTVDFPARQPTDNVVDYEALMAYAEESAAWASRGRQVHMARYGGETPQGEVEIRVRAQGDADFAVSRQAQVWQRRAAWVALPVLGAAIWSLAFLGVGRHSRHVQELPFWQGAWRRQVPGSGRRPVPAVECSDRGRGGSRLCVRGACRGEVADWVGRVVA